MREELIRSYYDKRADDEWRRFERHRMEFAISMRVLSAHLPAQGKVLDCGGGPGRFAIWLAGKGYQVTLFDLSEGCLEYARAQATVAGVSLRYERGSATDLRRFEGGEFQAVLLLGPLYHLLELDDRRKRSRKRSESSGPGASLPRPS
jgi:2-polyprenyl-3-methyl-5-hydroxy-6-metoxy-1,4-benzoquinol methylase